MKISHYEIKLKPIDGDIYLSIYLYYEIDDNGTTQLPVELGSEDGSTWAIVKPPNFFERLLGITFEDKVAKARKRLSYVAEKYIRKHNRACEIAKRLVMNSR